MIVLDASVVLDLLAGGEGTRPLTRRLSRQAPPWHAPQVLDLEVVHAVRREVRLGSMPLHRGEEVLQDLADMQVMRHDHQPLVWAIWRLRENLTASDAAYVALAESLDATLLTRDARLARAPGLPAKVELV